MNTGLVWLWVPLAILAVMIFSGQLRGGEKMKIKYLFRFPYWFSRKEYSLEGFIQELQGEHFHPYIAPAAVFGFREYRYDLEFFYSRTIFDWHMKELIQLARDVKTEKDRTVFLGKMIEMLGLDTEGRVEYVFYVSTPYRTRQQYSVAEFMRILQETYPTAYGLKVKTLGLIRDENGEQRKVFEQELPEDEIQVLTRKAYLLRKFWGDKCPQENINEFFRWVRISLRKSEKRKGR